LLTHQLGRLAAYVVVGAKSAVTVWEGVSPDPYRYLALRASPAGTVRICLV
jgi:hypothetical protein